VLFEEEHVNDVTFCTTLRLDAFYIIGIYPWRTLGAVQQRLNFAVAYGVRKLSEYAHLGV
jgi:hypothetical protein